MRVWDVSPGYLGRQSLLGEHLEIHAIASVIANGRKGYSRHPETLRWKKHLGALRLRHDLVAAEMELRGFNHRSPAPHSGPTGSWPGTFIDPPERQFALLRGKYLGKRGVGGRIPLPGNAQELWAQHKYSVLARDPERYRDLGRRVSRMRRGAAMAGLSAELVSILREPPPRGRLRNAVEHMWGYVADLEELNPDAGQPSERLAETALRARRHTVTYLLHSTALGELAHWVKVRSPG
jgi:uncharacterized protein YbgA (DUF1722 family)